MLTKKEYQDYWNSFILPIDKKVQMPSYYQYLQREIYFQDYLDLFIKTSRTEITFSRKIIDGVLTVKLPISIEVDEIFTKSDENGDVRLVVEHDFRFSESAFNNQSELRCVLIGEAAPSTGKYIYKDASGSYITAPLRAKGHNANSMKAVKRLEKLAESGFILLDLFPFSFDFNRFDKLRKNLVSNMTLMNKAINDLELKINNLTNLVKDWKYCFVGPETTSMATINFLYLRNYPSLAGKAIWHPNDLLNSNNFIVTKKNGKSVEYINYTANTNPTGIKLSHLSKHARMTTIIGGNGPHHELVYRALF